MHWQELCPAITVPRATKPSVGTGRQTPAGTLSIFNSSVAGQIIGCPQSCSLSGIDYSAADCGAHQGAVY